MRCAHKGWTCYCSADCDVLSWLGTQQGNADTELSKRLLEKALLLFISQVLYCTDIFTWNTAHVSLWISSTWFSISGCDSLAKHRMRTAMIGYISIADQIYKKGNIGIYCVEWEPYFRSAICERHSREKEGQLQAEARRSLSSLDWNCTGRPEDEST